MPCQISRGEESIFLRWLCCGRRHHLVAIIEEAQIPQGMVGGPRRGMRACIVILSLYLSAEFGQVARG